MNKLNGKSKTYLNRIIEETGLSRAEIFQIVEEKKVELKGLISDEGALFIIMKELGINTRDGTTDILADIEISISDLTQNMRNITLVGRIKLIYPIRSFGRTGGKEGSIGIFILHDRTGDIRIVLWNEHVEVYGRDSFRKNTLVKIINAFAKIDSYNNLEIHVGRRSRIFLNPADVDPNRYPTISEIITKVMDIKGDMDGKLISLEGKVIQILPPVSYETGYLISITLMDDSGIISIIFWGDDTEKIQNIKIGDNFKLSNLLTHRHRINNSIELFATPETTITRSQKDISLHLEYTEKISDLSEGLVHFKGYITDIENTKKIILKSGEENNVLNFFISDETGSIRVTIWGESALRYHKMLKEGFEVTLQNVMIRYNKIIENKEAIFLTSSSLELSTGSDIQNAEYHAIKERFHGIKEKYHPVKILNTSISSINKVGFYRIRGFFSKELSKIFFYEACPVCYKKVNNCSTPSHNREKAIFRMIINMVVDDETGTIRTAFMGRLAEKLINQNTTNIITIRDTPMLEEFLEKISAELIGRDIIITGRSRFNDYSNQYELIVDNFSFIDVDSELNEILKEMGN